MKHIDNYKAYKQSYSTSIDNFNADFAFIKNIVLNVLSRLFLYSSDQGRANYRRKRTENQKRYIPAYESTVTGIIRGPIACYLTRKAIEQSVTNECGHEVWEDIGKLES